MRWEYYCERLSRYVRLDDLRCYQQCPIGLDDPTIPWPHPHGNTKLSMQLTREIRPRGLSLPSKVIGALRRSIKQTRQRRGQMRCVGWGTVLAVGDADALVGAPELRWFLKSCAHVIRLLLESTPLLVEIPKQPRFHSCKLETLSRIDQGVSIVHKAIHFYSFGVTQPCSERGICTHIVPKWYRSIPPARRCACPMTSNEGQSLPSSRNGK